MKDGRRKFRRLAGAAVSVVAAAAMLLSPLSSAQAEETTGKPENSSEKLEKNSMKLKYDEPAALDHTGWENASLPIGNGYMGATVFGGIETERIQFNEKTLWTGGPDEEKRPDYNYGILPGKENLIEEIRQLFAEGRDDEAKSLTNQLTGANADAAGDPYGFGDYQNFGDLYFDFGTDPSGVENYERTLDLDTAVAAVDYDYEGVHYSREYFASYPDNVIVMRFTADEENSIDFQVRMESAQGAVTAAEGDTLVIRDKLTDNNLKYEAQLKVIPESGSVSGCSYPYSRDGLCK